MTTGGALTTPSQGPKVNVGAMKAAFGAKTAAAGKAAAASKVPNPLAPLNPNQLKQQAVKTVNSAFAPVYQGLNQQTKQSQGINDKRTSDNKYYLSWLNTQQASLQAHTDAANSQLAGLETTLGAQQQQTFQPQAANMVGQANARVGNVSNNAQSNAFGTAPSSGGETQLQASQAYNTQMLGASQQSAINQIGTANAQQTGSAGNSAGIVADLQQKDNAANATAMTNIANTRAKDQTLQSSDIEKEIARLQGVEIQKAQSNENFQAAQQKLGLTTANTASQITARTNSANAAQQRNQISAANTNSLIGSRNTTAALNLTKAQNSQMNADRTYKLDQQKYNSATAKDMYQRQHGLGPYKVAASKSGSVGSAISGVAKPLATASQNALYNSIDKIAAQYKSVSSTQPNWTPEQIYYFLQKGGVLATPVTGGTTGKPTTVRYAPEGNAQLLNAAYKIAQGLALNAGDVAALKGMGLANPGSRYSVQKTGSGIGTILHVL